MKHKAYCECTRKHGFKCCHMVLNGVSF